MSNDNNTTTPISAHTSATNPERDMLIYAVAELMRTRDVNIVFKSRPRNGSIDVTIPMSQTELYLFLKNYQANIK